MCRTVAICIAEVFIEQLHLVIITPVSMAALAVFRTPVAAITAHVRMVSGGKADLYRLQCRFAMIETPEIFGTCRYLVFNKNVKVCNVHLTGALT
jgi:hypothetical protein